MTSEYLSYDVCKKILQTRFNSSEIEYIKNEITPISENNEGYMGEHFNLVLTYKYQDRVETEILFMKRKPIKNKVQSDIADSCGVFKREIFLYDVLLKEFEKYDLDTSFAPKCFYCIPNEALILENLTTKGYNLFDRNVKFTTESLHCLLKNLALFHANGFVYEKIKSKELNRDFKMGEEYENILDELFFVQYIDKERYVMKFWDGCMVTLSVLIDLLPNDKSFNDKFKSIFQNYEFGKIFINETNIKKTCGHGDLWSNNMMFRTKNGALELKLCDFQVCRYFYPAFDLLLALYCNTDKQYRDKHLNELYKYYYDTLSTIVQDYGYNIKEFLSLEDFYKTINLVKADALIQVAYTNTFTCIPKEKLTEHVKSEEGVDELMFKNDKISAEHFQNNEIFRTTLIESLHELYAAMIEK